MFVFVGWLISVCCVFGAYEMMGGHLGALYQPLELVLIGGAAIGAFLSANNKRSIKIIWSDLRQVFRRMPYDKMLYVQIMSCMYALLLKARRDGVMKLEGDIEDPDSSPIFQRYPVVLEDEKVMEFIVDYVRIMVSGKMSPLEIEALMDEDLETLRHEFEVTVKAIRSVGDALPAFGIVAAVLGVIKALAAIDQEAYILADLISKAMVGTFLGIFLAYAFCFPLADTLERRSGESMKALECIKITLLAFMSGYPPQIAVEFGRKVLFTAVRPSFLELEKQVKLVKSAKSGG